MEQSTARPAVAGGDIDADGVAVLPAVLTRPEPRSPTRGVHTFSSLAHMSYRYLWIGTLFMSLGQWIQQVTLGYVMYDLTGSSVLLGVMSTVRALPFLFLSPVAGVIVDRVDRRKLLLAIQGSLVVTAIAMGLFVRSGLLEPWHLFVFSIITASAWAANQPLRQALVSMVVPREQVSNAVALNSVAFNITKIVGPALGGFLIAWVGASGNFLVQGLAYVAVLVSVGQIRLAATEGEPAQGSVWANMVEGFSYIRGSPAVLALLIAALVPSVMAMPYQTLMPVFQKDVLNVGPEGLGLMLAAPGIGAVICTLGLASFSERVRRKGYILLVAMAATGICLILFSRTTTLPWAMVALVGLGGFQILYNATNMTMLQLIVPDVLMGRVMSLYMINVGLSPAGALFGGIMTQAVGAPATLALMGALVVAMAVVMFFRNPEMRRVVT